MAVRQQASSSRPSIFGGTVQGATAIVCRAQAAGVGGLGTDDASTSFAGPSLATEGCVTVGGVGTTCGAASPTCGGAPLTGEAAPAAQGDSAAGAEAVWQKRSGSSRKRLAGEWPLART